MRSPKPTRNELTKNMAEIILLEDDFVLAQDYIDALQVHGHSVENVSSATEMLKRCKDKKFDLAIVDIFIWSDGRLVPDGGLSFISRLRYRSAPGTKTHAKIPIIAISGGFTAKPRSGPLHNARDLGAVETMSKPFSTSQLVEAVERNLP